MMDTPNDVELILDGSLAQGTKDHSITPYSLMMNTRKVRTAIGQIGSNTTD